MTPPPRQVLTSDKPRRSSLDSLSTGHGITQYPKNYFRNRHYDWTSSMKSLGAGFRFKFWTWKAFKMDSDTGSKSSKQSQNRNRNRKCWNRELLKAGGFNSHILSIMKANSSAVSETFLLRLSIPYIVDEKSFWFLTRRKVCTCDGGGMYFGKCTLCSLKGGVYLTTYNRGDLKMPPLLQTATDVRGASHA